MRTRKKYKHYNDTPVTSERKNQMKNLLAKINANKAIIIKTTLIVGGTAVGLLVASALLKNTEIIIDEIADVAEALPEL